MPFRSGPSPLTSLRTLAAAREQAAALGLNLFGLVDAARFDRCQPQEQRVRSLAPGCSTMIVLGSGGRALARDLSRQGANEATPASAEQHGWHRSCHIAALLQSEGLPCQAVAIDLGSRLPMGRLGEAAGFGTVSPVSGMLLHPEFGPWLRLRAALLFDGYPFGEIQDASITDGFHPCCNCARPCLSACPAQAHDGRGQSDLGRCASHRHAGGCETSCCSRSACPLGSEHRDDVGEFAHSHSFHLPKLQRWFGLGVWRVVPTFLRQGR